MAAIPAAVALSQVSKLVELLDSAVAIPVAVLFGLVAILLARRARVRSERTLGRVGGAWAARVGRVLGLLGVAAGLSAAIAVGFYYVLENFWD